MYENKKIGEKYEKKVRDKLEEQGYDTERKNGNYGEPDVIARDGEKGYGIEVKSCRFFVTDGMEYTCGRINVNKEAWKDFSDYCNENGLKRVVIVVLYQKGVKPVLLRYPPEEVDERMETQADRFPISIYQIMRSYSNLDLDEDPDV